MLTVILLEHGDTIAADPAVSRVDRSVDAGPVDRL
jgi:hypothetical protein